MNMFEKLYQHYKDTFDLEMRMRLSNTTYSQLEKMASKEDEWL